MTDHAKTPNTTAEPLTREAVAVLDDAPKATLAAVLKRLILGLKQRGFHDPREAARFKAEYQARRDRALPKTFY